MAGAIVPVMVVVVVVVVVGRGWEGVVGGATWRAATGRGSDGHQEVVGQEQPDDGDDRGGQVEASGNDPHAASLPSPDSCHPLLPRLFGSPTRAIDAGAWF
jgi:hypothetical protein